MKKQILAAALTLSSFSFASTWEIDTAHASANFSVKRLMVSTVKGHVSSVEGTISLDETDLAHSSVTVSLDAASIDTHEPKRDVHLRSADFLDVEQFLVVEADADVVLEHSRNMVRAARIAGQVVGKLWLLRGVGHGVLL